MKLVHVKSNTHIDSEPKSLKVRVEVQLDLSNYATKTD